MARASPMHQGAGRPLAGLRSPAFSDAFSIYNFRFACCHLLHNAALQRRTTTQQRHSSGGIMAAWPAWAIASGAFRVVARTLQPSRRSRYPRALPEEKHRRFWLICAKPRKLVNCRASARLGGGKNGRNEKLGDSCGKSAPGEVALRAPDPRSVHFIMTASTQ